MPSSTMSNSACSSRPPIPFTASTGTTYTVRLDVTGSTLNVYVNGTLQLTATDSSLASGAIGLNAFNATGEFDNVVVNATN